MLWLCITDTENSPHILPNNFKMKYGWFTHEIFVTYMTYDKLVQRIQHSLMDSSIVINMTKDKFDLSSYGIKIINAPDLPFHEMVKYILSQVVLNNYCMIIDSAKRNIDIYFVNRTKRYIEEINIDIEESKIKFRQAMPNTKSSNIYILVDKETEGIYAYPTINIEKYESSAYIARALYQLLQN